MSLDFEVSTIVTKVTPKGQQYLIQKYLGCTPLDLEAGA